MPGPTYLVLGAGFTGRRVAAALLARDAAVVVTTRSPARLDDLRSRGARVVGFDVEDAATFDALGRATCPGARVLHSVPSIRRGDALADPTPRLLEALGTRPARLVYLSSTGVYGAATEVDEQTPPAPRTPRETARHGAERAVAAGSPSSLVLRPAAIYGPGRGVHVLVREGRYRLVGEGRNVVSRIHVDDLAALALAALDHDLEGAWPVADDEPAEAREVAAFAARRLGVELPPSTTAEGVGETLRVTRRVDGRAVRELLGVTLRYPSYREGIPASIAAEARHG